MGGFVRILVVSGLLVLFSMNLWAIENWDSVESSDPKMLRPYYNYEYICDVEVSDRKKIIDEEGNAYILVAKSVIGFDNLNRYVRGKYMEWYQDQFILERNYIPDTEDVAYDLSEMRADLQIKVDPRRGDPKDVNSGYVVLNLTLGHSMGQGMYALKSKQFLGLRLGDQIFGEIVSKAIGTDGKHISLTMKVRCHKKK